MNFKYKYWYFTKAFSKAECRKIIKHAISKKKIRAKLLGQNKKRLSKKERDDLKKSRDSNIVWLNDKWLTSKIVPYLKIANQNCGWNFVIDSFEDIQFTIYKKGQYYNYHKDSLPEPYDRPDNVHLHGKIRKLSMSVCLSDPSDYEGGDFKMLINDEVNPTKLKQTSVKELKPMGSIIVFPSHEYHCVTPVTKGTRYSLVVWFLGKPFQ
jgi:PKHD-type hydroxylase